MAYSLNYCASPSRLPHFIEHLTITEAHYSVCLRVKHRRLRNTWGGSVTACTAIGKLIQRGRIGLCLPLHVHGDISETDVCFTNTLYMLHRWTWHPPSVRGGCCPVYQTMCNYTVVPVGLLGRPVDGRLSSVNREGLKVICKGFSQNWWKVDSSWLLQYKCVCVIDFDKLHH